MEPSTLVVAAVSAGLPSFIGWLLMRAVKGIDTSIAVLAQKADALSQKVDALSQEDTQIKIDLATLRARVTHLEIVVHGRVQIPDSNG